MSDLRRLAEIRAMGYIPFYVNSTLIGYVERKEGKTVLVGYYSEHIGVIKPLPSGFDAEIKNGIAVPMGS